MFFQPECDQKSHERIKSNDVNKANCDINILVEIWRKHFFTFCEIPAGKW